LGTTLKAQGKLKEAKKVLTEVYEESKEGLGEEHEDTLDAFQLLQSIP